MSNTRSLLEMSQTFYLNCFCVEQCDFEKKALLRAAMNLLLSSKDSQHLANELLASATSLPQIRKKSSGDPSCDFRGINSLYRQLYIYLDANDKILNELDNPLRTSDEGSCKVLKTRFSEISIEGFGDTIFRELLPALQVCANNPETIPYHCRHEKQRCRSGLGCKYDAAMLCLDQASLLGHLSEESAQQAAVSSECISSLERRPYRPILQMSIECSRYLAFFAFRYDIPIWHLCHQVR